MARYFTAVCAALIAAATFIGTSDEASARCIGCGPVPPVYRYRTVNQVMDQTQYRDVSVPNYVHRTRYIYNVTRVQPIVRVNTVTRYHHYDVPVYHDVSVPIVQSAPAQYVYTQGAQGFYDGCGCQ